MFREREHMLLLLLRKQAIRKSKKNEAVWERGSPYTKQTEVCHDPKQTNHT